MRVYPEFLGDGALIEVEMVASSAQEFSGHAATPSWNHMGLCGLDGAAGADRVAVHYNLLATCCVHPFLVLRLYADSRREATAPE